MIGVLGFRIARGRRFLQTLVFQGVITSVYKYSRRINLTNEANCAIYITRSQEVLPNSGSGGDYEASRNVWSMAGG